MEVDLLTNALVSNVGAASKGPEPLGSKPLGIGRPDSAAGSGRGEAVTPDNNQIDASKNLVNKKPSMDFAQTLEQKIKARAPETAENTEPTEAVATANEPSPEQLEPVQSEEAPDSATEMGEVLAVTAAQPQQQIVIAENSPQLLTNFPVAAAQETTAGQTETQEVSQGFQSAGQMIELTAEQGQMQTQSEQPFQDMLAVTEGARITQIAQTHAQGESNSQDSAAQQETTVEDKTGQLLDESLEQGAKTKTPIQTADSAIGQNPQTVTNADAILKDNPDAGKEASSDPQDGSARTGPNTTASEFADAQAKVDAEGQNKTLPDASDNSGKTILGNEETDSTESTAQKFNPTHVESVTSQSNAPQSAPVQADKSIELEQTVPGNTPQIQAPEQPLIVQTPNNPGGAAPGDNAANVSEQIRESITSSSIGPGREITIRLNPPELGTVVLKFQEQDNQITGILEVSRSQTRAEIQQVLPEITRDLQNFGIPIRRIEVVMVAEHESETLSSQSGMPQDDRWAGWEESQGSEPNEQDASVGGAFPQNIAYSGSSAYSRSYVTDRSIDMFV